MMVFQLKIFSLYVCGASWWKGEFETGFYRFEILVVTFLIFLDFKGSTRFIDIWGSECYQFLYSVLSVKNNSHKIFHKMVRSVQRFYDSHGPIKHIRTVPNNSKLLTVVFMKFQFQMYIEAQARIQFKSSLYAALESGWEFFKIFWKLRKTNWQ